MRTVLILTLICLSTACAGTIQFASITEAYKSYNNEKFEKTLKLISQAENAKEMHPEQKAEITYLKAQAYEGLGETDRSTILYEYIQDHYRNSQYGYLARRKFEAVQEKR